MTDESSVIESLTARHDELLREHGSLLDWGKLRLAVAVVVREHTKELRAGYTRIAEVQGMLHARLQDEEQHASCLIILADGLSRTKVELERLQATEAAGWNERSPHVAIAVTSCLEAYSEILERTNADLRAVHAALQKSMYEVEALKEETLSLQDAQKKKLDRAEVLNKLEEQVCGNIFLRYQLHLSQTSKAGGDGSTDRRACVRVSSR